MDLCIQILLINWLIYSGEQRQNKNLELTSLSPLGSLGRLFIMSDSAVSYANEIAGTWFTITIGMMILLLVQKLIVTVTSIL